MGRGRSRLYTQLLFSEASNYSANTLPNTDYKLSFLKGPSDSGSACGCSAQPISAQPSPSVPSALPGPLLSMSEGLEVQVFQKSLVSLATISQQLLASISNIVQANQNTSVDR